MGGTITLDEGRNVTAPSPMPEKQSLRRSWKTTIAAGAVIGAGILLPLLFLAWLIIPSDLDFISDYSPIRYGLMAIGAPGLLVFLIALIDFVVDRRRNQAGRRFPSRVTWLSAGVSIVIILAACGYVTLPKLLRRGDVPPQLIVTGNMLRPPGGEFGLSLAFWTGKPSTNTVRWRQGGSERWQEWSEAAAGNRHWFAFPGLKPNSRYEYSVNGGNATAFSTPPTPPEGPFRFAASGDLHIGATRSDDYLPKPVLDAITDPTNRYSMFFMLGDIVHLGFRDDQWKEGLRVISSLSSVIPTCYLIGNHDRLFGGVDLFRDYLCPRASDDLRQDHFWRRIDIGNIHFLLLELEWEDHYYTAAQEQWLTAQLTDIPQQDWCIVMSHTFYYCSGSEEDGWPWWDNQDTIRRLVPLFEKHKVDMVFSGHQHHAELLQTNGVTYVISGCFGDLPDPRHDHISPASTWLHLDDVYSFVEVTIDKDEAVVVFRDRNHQELHRTVITSQRVAPEVSGRRRGKA